MFTNIWASYLTLFHFVLSLLLVPTTLNAEGSWICFSSSDYCHCCFSFLFTLSIFLIICPLQIDGFLSATVDHHTFHRHLLKVELDWCMYALLLLSFLLCPCPQLAHLAVYNVVLHACLELQREDNCCVYWQKRQKHVCLFFCLFSHKSVLHFLLIKNSFCEEQTFLHT